MSLNTNYDRRSIRRALSLAALIGGTCIVAWLTLAGPRGGFEIALHSPSAKPDLECLGQALKGEFGAEHVTSSKYSVTVMHDACAFATTDRASLTYAVSERSGDVTLTVSDEWPSNQRLQAACVEPLTREVRRAFDAYASSCQPLLMGRWKSECRFTGVRAPDHECPDPKSSK